jgi:hypothetical protein
MMKNIAITGMTASQYSRSLNSSSLNFAGCVSDALLLCGEDVAVEWVKPSIHLTKGDLEKYDAVLVGLSPLLSLASHCSYGALHVIDLLSDDSRVHFFIDAPDPAKVRQSLKAVAKSPNALVKPLYKNRKEYKEVVGSESTKERLLKSVEYLASDVNYTVMFPSLPFVDDGVVCRRLFGEDSGRLRGYNFDSLYLEQKIDPLAAVGGESRWMVEGHKTRWFERMKNLLAVSWEPVKIKRMQSDDISYDRLSKSIGLILSPQNDSTTWWTYRLSQSLTSLVPVCAEWRDTVSLGDAWSLIPQIVEEMSMADRYSAAISQLEQYSSAVHSADEETSRLLKELSIL